MTRPRDVLASVNALQQGRLFKIIATIVVLAAAAIGSAAYAVAVTAPSDNAAAIAPPPVELPQGQQSALDAGKRVIDSVLAGRRDPINVAAGIVAVACIAVVVVWLGLGLTYLGLVGAAVLVALVPKLVGLASGSGSVGADGFVRLMLGVILLTASFSALLQAARLLLSGTGPVLAIARNVLVEAVRMKISLVFIVMLILGLAALPGLLSDGSPLRYRMQTFLQYSTGGTFWIIAILTLFFSIASITGEQRDKVIWQTVTKPVAAWQYVLGKWLGVVVLNAVLMLVCAGAIFMFAEYLRGQPAIGEQRAFEAEAGRISSDRLILETQVLTARVSEHALPPRIVGDRFEELVQQRIEAEQRTSDDFRPTPQSKSRIEREIRGEIEQAYRTIEPGQSEMYVFEGLGSVRQSDKPITFRYKFNAGTNRPDEIYNISISVRGTQPIVIQTAPGQTHSIDLLPEAVTDDGRLGVEIGNGDVYRGEPNAASMTFPPGGLEVFYSAGSYRANYMRIMCVLWAKLAFLAMIGVLTSVFLNFPVACLVSFTAFLAAEATPFLTQSLEYYGTTDKAGKAVFFKQIIHGIGSGVVELFGFYADLRPTQRLVEGLMLGWGSALLGVVVLGVLTGLLYGVSVIVFRRREMAIYSGQ